MINWKNMAKVAKEYGWDPIGNFDINGDLPEGSPVDHEKAFGRAMKYGLLTGGSTWLTHYIISRYLQKKHRSRKADRVKEARRRLLWSLGLGAAAAGIGYGSSVIDDAIRGTRFNYPGYKSAGKGDYNIVVAGAGSGAHERWYKRTYDKAFNGEPYVMFNPNDRTEMNSFVDSLPVGSRIRIWGHSRGGYPAWELARHAHAAGMKVDQLNTVDAVGKPWDTSTTPEDVRKVWTNYIIDSGRPYMNSSLTRAVKDFVTTASIDGDLVATLGGITGYLQGANNQAITNPSYQSHGMSIFGVLLNDTKKRTSRRDI